MERIPLVAAADIGGTFTDVAVLWSDGDVSVAKVLSTPGAYDLAVKDGVAAALGDFGGSYPPLVVHGTTIATTTPNTFTAYLSPWMQAWPSPVLISRI